jgi:hypothetical protein
MLASCPVLPLVKASHSVRALEDEAFHRVAGVAVFAGATLRYWAQRRASDHLRQQWTISSSLIVV